MTEAIENKIVIQINDLLRAYKALGVFNPNKELVEMFVDAMIQEHAFLHKIRELLRPFEWIAEPMSADCLTIDMCRWCHEMKSSGHTPDCPLAEALSACDH